MRLFHLKSRCFFPFIVLMVSYFNQSLTATSAVLQYYHTIRYTKAQRWPQRLYNTTKAPPITVPQSYNEYNEYGDIFQYKPFADSNQVDTADYPLVAKAALSDESLNTAASAVPTLQLEEGAFCRRSFDGRSGYCILAYQCIHVIRDHRLHGTKIDVCGYRKHVPVICCPLGDKHVEDVRISLRKCQEYYEVLGSVKINSATGFSGKSCVPSVPMIVGGVTTLPAEYPHMVALGWSQGPNNIKWGCGGSLISEIYVLTAAHCVTSGGKPPDIVRLGAHSLNFSTPTQQDIKILIIMLHPQYSSSSYYNDVALLKLTKSASFTPSVRPGCLWQSPHIDVPAVTAIGWGRTSFMGAKSATLQKVDLKLIDQKVCKDLYRRERRLPRGLVDEQLCAGYLTGGRDTCQGDSGGPLYAEIPEYKCVKFIVGVTSFGKYCAASNAPGVYTKVYAYLDWIEQVVFRN